MSAAATGRRLLRLTVPRLQGHSFQDTQTYKSEDFVASEWARDPLPKLKAYLVGSLMSEAEWDAIAARGRGRGRGGARARPRRAPVADPETRDRATSSTTARCSRWAGNGPRAIARRARPRRRGPRASGSTW